VQTREKSSEPRHEPASAQPEGVLLVNLGSPRAPTSPAVRAFLREFLGDPKVVDANPLLWWLVLNTIVLPRRSRASARAYRSIWMAEGSPLIVISRRQHRALAQRLGSRFRVALAMRYGEPSISAALGELAAAGCRRLRLLPMFPQVSVATTSSVREAVQAALRARAGDLELVEVAAYYQHPGYVNALATRVRESLEEGPVDHCVFSFHGLPVRLVEAGDPYRDHCVATARALALALELGEDQWSLSYQSRFGREAWLEPDTAQLVPSLAARARRVLIACPGFPTDCLETLEEIDLRLRADFRRAGGEELRVVPCLNDHPQWIEGMAQILTH
jgi:ferrochelatase